jgi:hypothetical protein
VVNGYLIYHPRRTISTFESVTVYHDSIGGNQDPYIWNKSFLHTYCHITQMSPQIGDMNFWVSGDTFPHFSHLYCDLVFLVTEKIYWGNANVITRDDQIVDSDEAYIDHYSWAYQHPFKRRRRFTLKADPERSFQPQTAERKLIDILPFLSKQGLSLEYVRRRLRAGFNSQPLRLEDLVTQLYGWLDQMTVNKLYGTQLYKIRQNNPCLASSSQI